MKNHGVLLIGGMNLFILLIIRLSDFIPTKTSFLVIIVLESKRLVHLMTWKIRELHSSVHPRTFSCTCTFDSLKILITFLIQVLMFQEIILSIIFQT